MWWRWHWKKYGGRRAAKIFLDSALSIEKWRGALTLWGGAFATLLFFGTPLGDVVMSTWHLLPWWTVPVFLLVSLLALFVRGLVKANYGEVQRLEEERDDLREEAQQPLAPPNEDLRQRSCKLAAELYELIEQWQNGVDAALAPGLMASVQREANGDPDGSLEIRAHGIWLMREYSKLLRGKMLKLSDELAQHRCITPGTRNRFENSPTKPEDIEDIARRLKVICGEPEEELTYQENRSLFHEALTDRLVEGNTYFEDPDFYEADVIEKWEKRTSKLITAALDQDVGMTFLIDDDIALKGWRTTPLERRVAHRMHRLGQVMDRVDSSEPLELQSDFDGRNWVSKN